MTAADLVYQLNQSGSTGNVLVQTSSGIFVVSAVQQGEDGSIVLRAMETPAGADGLAQYQEQRNTGLL
jgi:hypothetical protein